MKLNKPLLINFIGFQLLWLLCVQGSNLVALLALTLFLFVHAKWVLKLKSEWLHGLIFLIIGACFETALWVGFSTTLHHSMSWLAQRPLLQVTLVSVSIPLTYYAGARFSGSILSAPLWLPLLVITGFWLCVLPFGFWLRTWLQRSTEAVHV